MSKSVTLRTGASMPLVGLGTFQSKPEEIEQAVKVALETGYRHIDTAYMYQNEDSIGRALKQAFDSGLVRREDLFIVTKLPNNGHRRDKVIYFLKKSLAKLQLDYVDLYLVHTPFPCKGKHDDDFFALENGVYVVDTEADLVETWKGMEDAVDAGLTKAIGISNFNSEQIKRIYNNSRIKPANLQVEVHAYFAQKPLYELCKSLNIPITAYGPLGAPYLKKLRKEKFNMDIGDVPILLEDPVLKSLSEKYKKKPSQIALRWLNQRGIIAIPKSTNPERIRENFQVFDFELAPSDVALIDGLDKNQRLFKADMFKGLTDHPEYPFKIPF